MFSGQICFNDIMDEDDGRPKVEGWPRRLQAYESAIVIADAVMGGPVAALLSGYFAEVTLLERAGESPICLDARGERVAGVQPAGEAMLPASMVLQFGGEGTAHGGPEGLLVVSDGKPLPAVLRALRASLDEQRRRYGRNHLYGLAGRFRQLLADAGS